MAIVNRLKQDEIKRQFTHYALFAGLVPCYVSDDAECRLQERNWIPEVSLTAAQWLYGNFIAFMSLLDDDYEPMWPIVITGEINASVKEQE